MLTSLDRFKKKVANLFKESGEVNQQKVSANQNSQTLEVPVAAPKQNMPPKTKAELIKILRRCNPNVLSDHEKNVIATTMSFDKKTVKDIMLPKKDITFVHDMDFLGPLTLDKLYQSGYEDFPVLGPNGQVVGMLNTHDFNNLTVKETDRVVKYLSHKISYIREDYTLTMALTASLRTNSRLFLVINKYKQIVGMITLQDILEYLLGGTALEDTFDADYDIDAVAKRS